MIRHAPSTATDAEQLYECGDCASRVEAASSPATCPDCGGVLRNIAVPRE